MLKNIVMKLTTWWANPRSRTILLGCVAAVVILGVLLWGFSRNQAAKTVAAAFANFAKASTYHARAEITASLPVRSKNRARPFTRVQGRVEGDVQENSQGTPELTGQLYGELRGSGSLFFADGDIRIGNEVTAFRLENLPVFFNPSRRLVKKWTHVDTALLATQNGNAIRETLRALLGSVTPAGKEKVDGTTLSHFRVKPTAEQEEALIKVLQESASGNPAWNMVARLTNSFNISQLDVYVEPGSEELRRIVAVFGRPNTQGRFIRRAVIDVRLSDYGKKVEFAIPDKQLTVQPEVFGQLLGTGEIIPQ